MRTKERDNLKTITFDIYAENSPFWGVSRNGVPWMVRRSSVGIYLYNLDPSIHPIAVVASAQSASGLIAQPTDIAPGAFNVYIYNHAGTYADSVHRVIVTAMDRRL